MEPQKTIAEIITSLNTLVSDLIGTDQVIVSDRSDVVQINNRLAANIIAKIQPYCSQLNLGTNKWGIEYRINSMISPNPIDILVWKAELKEDKRYRNQYRGLVQSISFEPVTQCNTVNNLELKPFDSLDIPLTEYVRQIEKQICQYRLLRLEAQIKDAEERLFNSKTERDYLNTYLKSINNPKQ